MLVVVVVVPTLLVLAGAAPASAQGAGWQLLPGPAGASSLVDTASRDAPVLEYAFGPSGQVSLGHALALAGHACARGGGPAFHLRLSGLVALEDASSGTVLPDELARVVATTGVAWTFFGEAGAPAFEIGLEVGVERARELVGAPSERVDLPPEPDDIPFGGGGVWLGLDLSLALALGDGWTLRVRVADRMFVNAFPLLFGLVAESDSVASYLDEGLTHAPSLALGLEWVAGESVHPFVRVFVEGLFPHDDSAATGAFFRGMLGAALPGAYGELAPFVSLDVGNGKGLLVNRHELRFSIGARHVFR